MKSELLSAEWCELVFAGRNQDYGAFRLRAEAGRRYAWALGLLVGAFLLAALLFGGLTLWMYYRLSQEAAKAQQALQELRKDAVREGYELKFLQTTQVLATIHAEEGETETVPTIQDGLAEIKKFGAKGIVAYSPEEDVILLAAPNDPEPEDETLERSKERIVPTEMVKELPRFPGGNRAFMRWLDEHLTYPKRAIDAGFEGTVMLSFIVGTDGRATEVEIEPEAPEEVMRALRSVVARMPKWTPGCGEDGTPTPVKISVPVEFRR